MRKIDELTREDSCLGKAKATELLFVLLARDAAAPNTIRFWVSERIRLGKNDPMDGQMLEALKLAEDMERERSLYARNPDAPSGS